MSDKLLPCVEHGPADASHSIIWLHGLGANGHDFEPLIPELALPASVRFVFPHAPERAVTINGGMRMPAWYDIYGPEFATKQDDEGIHQSQQQLEALIEREVQRGVVTENIILAGFSQGGAIALHTGLRYPQKLSGILALSTYLPLASTLPAEASEANRAIPIFQAHGLYDPVVPVDLAEYSKQFLEQNGYQVQWKTYEMEHSLHPDEVADIQAWLRERINGE